MPDKREKRCTVCRTVKPLDEFGLLAGRPDGHESRCRECVGGSQHVDLYRKVLLRERLATRVADDRGAAYVPFVGDGDLAERCWAGRRIFAVDLDPERVATAANRLDDAVVIEADADLWHADQAPDLGPYTVGDFDAYVYPYASFREWWRQTDRTDRVLVAFTDGQLQGIKRSKVYRHPDGTIVRLGSTNEMRATFNNYWGGVIRPWLEDFTTAEGWSIVDTGFYVRSGHMLYWAAVLQRNADADTRVAPTRAGRAPEKADRRRRWSNAVADELVNAIASGCTVEQAAAQVGISARTAQRKAKDDAELAARIEEAKAERGAVRADAFDEGKRAAYLDELRAGKRPTFAAESVNVHPATVRRRRELDAEFDDACRWAEQSTNEAVEDGLYQAAKSGHVVAAIFWLTNRMPDRWRDRRNVGIHGVSGEPAVATSAGGPSLAPEDLLAALVGTDEGADVLDRLADLTAEAARRTVGEEEAPAG